MNSDKDKKYAQYIPSEFKKTNHNLGKYKK